MSNAIDVAQTFVLDTGWIFFAAWAVVLAAVSVLAFGRDVLRFKQRETSKKRISR